MGGPAEKHIFRIVYDVRTFPKAEYKALLKRTLKVHERFIFSSFPEEIESVPVTKNRLRQFNESDTVFLIDRFSDEQSRSSLRFIKTSERPVPLLVFNISRIGDQLMWNLNYKYNKKSIGEPERDDFYLFSAEDGKRYLFYINGFVERGEQGNKTRLYHEHVYYIEYLGKKKLPADGRYKGKSKVPVHYDKATVIDLRKLFY